MHGMNFRYKLFVMSIGLAHGLVFASQADVTSGKEDQTKKQIVNEGEKQETSDTTPAVVPSAPTNKSAVVEKITEQPKKASDVFLEAVEKFEKFVVAKTTSEETKKSSLEQLTADEKRREEKLTSLREQREALAKEHETKKTETTQKIAALDKLIIDAETRKKNEAQTQDALEVSLTANLNKIKDLAGDVNEESARAKKNHAGRVKEVDSLTEKSLADSMASMENAFDLCIREEGNTTTECRANFHTTIMSTMTDGQARQELLTKLHNKAIEQEKKAKKDIAFTVSEGEKKKAGVKLAEKLRSRDDEHKKALELKDVEHKKALELKDIKHRAGTLPGQLLAAAGGFTGGAAVVGSIVGGLLYKGILKTK